MGKRIIGGMLCLLAAAFLVAGCSGGDSNSIASPTGNTGGVKVSVVWPEATKALSRYIPTNAKSIEIRVHNSDSSYDKTEYINRPNTDTSGILSFTDVPVGEVTIDVTVYPNAAAPRGNPLAKGSATAKVYYNTISSVTINLNSTVAHLELSEVNSALRPEDTVTLHVMAYNSAEQVVTIPVDGYSWTTSDVSIATIVDNNDGTCTVTAVAEGAVTITVRDKETGVSVSEDLIIAKVGASGTLVITIGNPSTIVVRVSPPTVTVPHGSTKQFTAKVFGTLNQMVTWSVEADGAGGTINEYGLYTAPASAGGTDTIKATSTVDGTTFDTAIVTVN